MMPVEQHTRHPARDARVDVALSRQVPRSRPEALPAWESFPLADRQRLVTVILQAARRQVEARSASRLATT
ncbi:MAG TPA: hypothetical protein VFN05_07320 [Actinomycetes bacterium]|nr:hypothetical protein [Actinomycetes bacterium]